jgi:hypothetical protein
MISPKEFDMGIRSALLQIVDLIERKHGIKRTSELRKEENEGSYMGANVTYAGVVQPDREVQGST